MDLSGSPARCRSLRKRARDVAGIPEPFCSSRAATAARLVPIHGVPGHLPGLTRGPESSGLAGPRWAYDDVHTGVGGDETPYELALLFAERLLSQHRIDGKVGDDRDACLAPVGHQFQGLLLGGKPVRRRSSAPPAPRCAGARRSRGGVRRRGRDRAAVLGQRERRPAGLRSRRAGRRGGRRCCAWRSALRC